LTLEMDGALHVALLACGALAALAWLLSIATREYSWVDRVWSIAPPCYVWWFAYSSAWDARVVLMAALATAWGARLTFNFARKGGYAPGGEDYRWKELRSSMSAARFQLMNFFFVAGIQDAIILGFTLPAWMAARHAGAPLGPLDFVATALFLVLLAGETIADQQQWRFHVEKARKEAAGEPLESEFLRTGLFRWSRHPNFFCEQAIWWAFYLFSIAAGAGALNVTVAGAIVLTALFQGSTRFTEKITLRKYPGYAEYQRTTSRLWPLPPKGPAAPVAR
jgi:steroid 5-alpha reductase family enzyme